MILIFGAVLFVVEKLKLGGGWYICWWVWVFTFYANMKFDMECVLSYGAALLLSSKGKRYIVHELLGSIYVRIGTGSKNTISFDISLYAPFICPFRLINIYVWNCMFSLRFSVEIQKKYLFHRNCLATTKITDNNMLSEWPIQLWFIKLINRIPNKYLHNCSF